MTLTGYLRDDVQVQHALLGAHGTCEGLAGIEWRTAKASAGA